MLPEPQTHRVCDEDFAAAYVNYYVCNGAVIAAEFGDDKAAEILKQLYPQREIVSLNIDAIGQSGGGIDCVTQKMPKSA